MNQGKVVIIGAGHVGSHCAYALAASGVCGEIVLVDSVARLVPGVLGNDESPEDESFTSGLLEYPQYTRPREYRGLEVPEVLLNGNHAEILK